MGGWVRFGGGGRGGPAGRWGPPRWAGAGKRCPRPWVDSGPAWAQFKRRVFEKEEEEMEIYTSVEGAPAWAQETIRRAMRTPSREGGGTLLSGDGQGKLRLTGETIVTLELLRKAGLLSE